MQDLPRNFPLEQTDRETLFHPMTSIADYVTLETGFTAVQFLIIGPLIALAYRN